MTSIIARLFERGLAGALAKDSPASSDVHVSSTGKKPLSRTIMTATGPKPALDVGRIDPEAKLPITGADLAAQLEEAEEGKGVVKPGYVGKAGTPRALKPIDDKTSHSPFPYDPSALANMRSDQKPRFFGALTDQKSLDDKEFKFSDLVAMQDRVDPAKVEGMRGGDGQPLVVGMNGRNYIADGHHRATAAWMDGKDKISAKFKDLEPVDQALKSLVEKFGARNSRQDATTIQAIHDHACALGANCRGEPEPTGATAADWEDEGSYVKNDADWQIPFKIAKADPDQQLIFGWASVVEKDGHLIIDKQGDIILPEDLEKAAYDFALFARDHGHMHTDVGTGRMVETMVFTKEKQDALGIDLGMVGWWVGFRVDDSNVWAAHKRGDLPEFSIGGTGRRVDV